MNVPHYKEWQENKPSFMTRDGMVYDFKDLTIGSVTHALANSTRFAGQPDRQVSIGQHLLHCVDLSYEMDVSEDVRRLVLWHDVPEAFYSDIPTYVKAQFPELKEYLNKLDTEIYQAFGINEPTPEQKIIIKQIDYTALALEAEYAFDKFDPKDWPKPSFYSSTDKLQWWAGLPPIDIEEQLIEEFAHYGSDY